MTTMTKARKMRRIGRKEAMWGIIFALPAMLGFLIWTVGPMLASFGLSLTRWTVAGQPQFTGLANYRAMFFEDDLFWKSIGVTAYYAIGSVPAVTISAFLVAMLLNQKVKALATFRTIFYLPSIVPVIASSVLWMWLFNPDFGLLNLILGKFGLPRLQWIYSSRQVIPSLIMMSGWAMGNTMVIFLAGLQGVPQYLYEVVEIDGGNWWHKFRHITIPMISPIIFFNVVMNIIGSFQVFTQAYIMTDGGPKNASLFYVFYLYRSAFLYNKMGYACGLAWILFLIILAFTIVVFKSAPFWVYYEAERRR